MPFIFSKNNKRYPHSTSHVKNNSCHYIRVTIKFVNNYKNYFYTIHY